MTGPLVLLLIGACAVLLTAAFLVGQAELDELLERWRADRDVRRSVEEWERARRHVQPPRSVP